MADQGTSYEQFQGISDDHRRLLRQEELLLEVTEKVLEAMEQQEVSQAEMARRLGKSRSYVSQLLAGGRNLTLRTVADLGDALGQRIELHLIGRNTRRSRQQRKVVRINEWQKKSIPQVSSAIPVKPLERPRMRA